MALSAWQATIVNKSGDVIPSASVQVIDKGTGLAATIYSTAGGASLGNPFLADTNGFAQFYTNAGTYRIIASDAGSGFSETWEDQRLGDAQARDTGTSDGEVPTADLIGDVEVTATGTTTPRSLAEWTSKETLTYNSIADAKADTKLSMGQSVKTLGCYSAGDGGGAEYVIVAGGTGIDDGGSYHDMANGNQLQLLAIGNRKISLKAFGATGNELDDNTTAIDNWLTFAASLKPNVVPVINGSRSILNVSEAPTLYIPSGTYNYSGVGFEPVPFNSVFQFVGDGPDTSVIRILTDTHLIRETDDTDTIRLLSTYNLGIQGGRGLFLSTKMNVAAVQYGFSFHKTKFWGYTSCAVGSYRLNAARWWVSECVFSAGNTGTPVGILFPPEAGMIDMHGNIFSDNKYHVICGEQSVGRFTQSRLGPHNSFFDAGINDRVADIWLIPSPIDIRNGRGVEIAGNRFSNENADLDDFCILIADRDEAQPDGVFEHLTTLSDATFRSLRVVNNNITRNGRIAPEDSRGAVYSYAYKVGGMLMTENSISSVPFMLEFDPVVTPKLIDLGKNHLNRFYTGKFGQSFGEPSPKKGCNVDGGGMLINLDGGSFGTGRGLDYSDYGDVGIVKLLPNNNPDGGIVGAGVTKTLVPDVSGGALAIELEFADENAGIYLFSTGVIESNFIAGKQAFVEFDVKSGASNSLEQCYINFSVNGGLTREMVIITDEWTRVKFPVAWCGDYSVTGDFQIYISAENNVTPTNKTVQIGRRSFYHASGQVPYSVQAI